MSLTPPAALPPGEKAPLSTEYEVGEPNKRFGSFWTFEPGSSSQKSNQYKDNAIPAPQLQVN